ncbi:MAG TPA: hypothetical protein VHS81_03225, partial [Caulobacteraceae bacterium]|nr:hypothetical protein [Caulobacteraceae bacterium]
GFVAGGPVVDVGLGFGFRDHDRRFFDERQRFRTQQSFHTQQSVHAQQRVYVRQQARVYGRSMGGGRHW